MPAPAGTAAAPASALWGGRSRAARHCAPLCTAVLPPRSVAATHLLTFTRPTRTCRPLRLSCSAVGTAFDGLTRGFEQAWATLQDADDLSPRNMRAPLRELRRTLLEADVSLAAVTAFLKAVEAGAAGVAVTPGVTPRDQLIKVVNDQLTEALGGAGGGDVALAAPAGGGPTVVVLAGLQGAGKTTAAAKLAALLQAQGKTPFLVAADTFRPAAAEQLRVLGAQAGVPVFPPAADHPLATSSVTPAQVAAAGVQAGKDAGCDVILVDTAGRVTVDEQVMKQLEAVMAAVSPTETFLVVDAMAGQDAARTAAAFNARVALTGVVLTKLDGDARGGAALSVRHACGQRVRYVGTGEKLRDLEPFRPERVASRILGMGDVVSLVEAAQKAAAASGRSQSQLEQLGRRMMSAQFDLNDFMQQSEVMASMGSMAQVTRMLPGIGSKVNDAQIADAERRLRVFRSVIQSMTPAERAQPALVAASQSRMSRIAKGSGRKVDDVNNLLMTWAGMRDQMTALAKRLGMGADGIPPTAEQIRQAGLEAATAAQRGKRGKEQAWREEQKAAKKAPAVASKGFGAAKGFGRK